MKPSTPGKHCIRRAALLCATLFISIGLAVCAENPQLRTMQYKPGSKADAEKWQNEVRGKLFHLLKIDDLVQRSEPIPFDVKTISEEDKGAYVKRELEINTTPGRRMRVVVTTPKAGTGGGTYPALVCIHGHGHDRFKVHDPDSIYKGFASVMAAKGYVTISMDVGQHEVYEPGRILMGERLWDVMRCVDYLGSMPEVDSKRIGCAGLSLGGEMTMWLGAMDTRIAATLSAGFLTVMDQMEQNHCMCWKFDGLRELVDYADIYTLTAPRALQCQNGEKEGPTQFYVPIARKALEEIKPIYKDYGQPENVELHVHPGGHEIDLPALVAFFEKHL